MIPALGRFVEALRGEGVAVSPAELLDATRAVEAIGLEDRARFRAALATTLAKGRRQREVFERLFESFFAPPPGPGKGKGTRPGSSAGEGAPRRRAQGGSSGARSRPRADEPRPRARADERRPERKVRAMVEEVRAARRVGRLRVVRVEPRAGETKGPEAGLRCDPGKRDLKRPMTGDEERELAREVPKLVERIRLRSGRRFRASRSGRLSPRRLFRENVASGGVPFVLPLRRPKPRRPRVVLLVDVSFSVARSAGYFLLMAAEFLRIGRDARVIAFVDRPVDATRAVRRWLARGRGAAPQVRAPAARPRRRGRRPGEGIAGPRGSFADLLDSLRGLNLDAPSDYGRALHGLLRSELRPRGRDTILVVLGDGRTNRLDPLPWTLEEIARQVRALLWLVPEPEEQWGTGDSALAHYLPFVDVAVEARDLAGLARGLTEIVRRL